MRTHLFGDTEFFPHFEIRGFVLLFVAFYGNFICNWIHGFIIINQTRYYLCKGVVRSWFARQMLHNSALGHSWIEDFKLSIYHLAFYKFITSKLPTKKLLITFWKEMQQKTWLQAGFCKWFDFLIFAANDLKNVPLQFYILNATYFSGNLFSDR